MRLLVSVTTAMEVPAALEGGADIVDAKDALTGALGPVSLDTLRAIHAAVAGARPVTAALGDASDEAEIEHRAYGFALAGVEFVKVGFAGITDATRIAGLISATVRGAAAGSDGRAGVVAVAYADADRVSTLAPATLPDIAVRAGAVGLLMDTADKTGPGLRGLVTPNALAAWVTTGHDNGLFVALAGKLTPEDLPFAHGSGADIAGVRGAACLGGRSGRVAADKVRMLRTFLRPVDLAVQR